MPVWAIADLHLSFGVPDKGMEVFGKHWQQHANKIEKHWRSMIAPDDLVLIPGDISWAMRLEDAIPDLQWLHALPGVKVILKGNHDYWWGSLSKVVACLPPSIHLIQNSVFNWKGVSIGGARLWDTPEYSFREWIEFQENPKARKNDPEVLVQEEFSEKIFNRELERLKRSLEQLDPSARLRLAMTHYPPIDL